jgi:hypothetical protein
MGEYDSCIEMTKHKDGKAIILVLVVIFILDHNIII